jgi:hypothetical protein
MKAYWEWRYSFTIDLGSGWRFMPPPLNPRGKSPSYQLDRKVGEGPSVSGLYGVEKNLLSPVGNQTPAAQPVAIPTELSRLPPVLCASERFKTLMG